ncbi:alpha/beta hydrolase [Cohnella mopanensis]|uniref:alpha/beta hydrolase n=1 Tax=Cohnella mopanensis TaxID=2911966 RepID=UPI001EF97F30|nr:hypothetical protein [Cohnella mopanensis]
MIMHNLPLENKPITSKRAGGWPTVASVLFGVVGVIFALLWPTVRNLQHSTGFPIQWPFVSFILLLLGSATWLLVKARKRHSRRSLVMTIGVTLVVGLLLFESTIYLAHERVIFMQPKLSENGREYVKNVFQNVEEISIETNDQIALKGWIIRNAIEDKAPLMIYFAGNNDNVPPIFLTQLTGLNIAFVNYRGYGLSEGTPSEFKIKEDSLTFYDTLVQNEHVDNGQIIIAGRSLGSGVATYLASNRAAKAVILISPYDSMSRVVHDMLPMYPQVLSNTHFDSYRLAPAISAPVLSFIAEQDTTVIPERSESLLKQWAGDKHTVYVPGANHNSIMSYPIIVEETIKFLDGVLARN